MVRVVARRNIAGLFGLPQEQAMSQHPITVTVNGEAVQSTVPARRHPLQESFMQCGGLQCGYCTPGFLMTSCAMLANNPSPSEEEVRHGLNGNLCRCTGYTQIVESILSAAEKMRGN